MYVYKSILLMYILRVYNYTTHPLILYTVTNNYGTGNEKT